MSDNNLTLRKHADVSLNDWREQEKKALELLQLVGELRFDKTVDLLLFRRDIYDVRPSEVLNTHKYATNYANQEVTIDTTLALAKTISNFKNIAPSRIDLGTLALEWIAEKDLFSSEDEFIGSKLNGFDSKQKLVELVPLLPKESN
jgi:glyceraldehyde 3-phosphate dehydrogenase